MLKATAETQKHEQIAHAGLIASMCLYAVFVGYMLAEQVLYRPEPALLFGIAMAAHFLGVDHTLVDDAKNCQSSIANT